MGELFSSNYDAGNIPAISILEATKWRRAVALLK
jgi:hypothetical protein